MASDYSPKDGCDTTGIAFNLLLRIEILSEAIESTQSPTVIRVEILPVSSSILAAKSPFFHKLFSSAVIESEQSDITLRINASEKDAFMELLNFMCSENLTVKTVEGVLDVLIAAHKFEVASYMRYCSRVLRKLPMTPESVLVYLDLPSTILTSKAYQQLTLAAKQFYVVHYKDMTKFEDHDIMNLPLASLEAIISSDDLQVCTEDVVCSFVLKWVRTHYPEEKDRREIITRLAKFIRYPYMTYKKLKELQTCREFDPTFAQKVLEEAISFQATVPQKRHRYISDEHSNFNHRFVERAYKYRPIMLVEFKQPNPDIEVYFDVKHDVCASLYPSGAVESQGFNIGRLGFYLCVQCSKTINMLEERSFRFILGTHRKVAVSFRVDYEFAIGSRPHEEFVTICKGSYRFAVKKGRLEISLFVIPWRLFIGKDGVYFINDLLHLRTKLAIRDLAY